MTTITYGDGVEDALYAELSAIPAGYIVAIVPPGQERTVDPAFTEQDACIVRFDEGALELLVTRDERGSATVERIPLADIGELYIY